MNKTTFRDLNLSPQLLSSIEKMGFTQATPVQSASIAPMLEKKDILVQSPTGSGKTCAFGIPLIESLHAKVRGIQALVLCPTRELAIQTGAVLKQLVQFTPSIKIATVYGGEKYSLQMRALKQNPQVIVATPGRMADFIERGIIDFEQLSTVILDEADRMLEMGFRDELDAIFSIMPAARQTVMFSATLSPQVKQIAAEFQSHAELIHIAQNTETLGNVTQHYVNIKGKTKIPVLIKLLEEERFSSALVFVGTKAMVETVTKHLLARGIQAAALHGDLKQQQRDAVMKKYRRNAIDVLVATDVAARGIDVNDIAAVINFDIPQNSDDYTHRIGRTGRAMKSGVAYTFIYPKEKFKLNDIIARTKASIGQIQLSVTPAELQQWEQSNPSATREVPVNKSRERAATGFTRTTRAKPSEIVGTSRLFISVGVMDQMTRQSMAHLVNEHGNVPSKLIGTISVHSSYSFVDVPTAFEREVMSGLGNMTISGRKVRVEVRDGRPHAPAGRSKSKTSKSRYAGRA